MEKHITSSTFISRWLENFQYLDNSYDYEFLNTFEAEDYEKLRISQKIDLFSKNNIAYIDDQLSIRSIPEQINPKLQKIICDKIFYWISEMETGNYEKYCSRIELLIEGLDKKNQLKIINKNIKKINK